MTSMAKYAIDSAEGHYARLFIARDDLVANSDGIDVSFCQSVRHQHGRITNETACFGVRRRIGNIAVNFGIIEFFVGPPSGGGSFGGSCFCPWPVGSPRSGLSGLSCPGFGLIVRSTAMPTTLHGGPRVIGVWPFSATKVFRPRIRMPSINQTTMVLSEVLQKGYRLPHPD